MSIRPKRLKRQPGSSGPLLFALALLLAACGSDKDVASPPTDRAAAATEPATVAPAGEHAVDTPRLDPSSGLVIDQGWELVRGTCSACHSARLVTQNRGSRETWKSMIRWMQETQGLWQLDPATENAILDYLARNYAPAASSRRAALPAELLPENPYHKSNSS